MDISYHQYKTATYLGLSDGIFFFSNTESLLADSGPLFTKKTPSYQYRDSHYKPETVVRPSKVYHGNPYTRKTASS